MKTSSTRGNSGISPVIGVVIMVAVVVAVVGLVTITVFNVGGDPSNSADASVEVSESSSGVSFKIIRNENVEEFVVSGPDGYQEVISGESGSSATIADGPGEYTVVGRMDDGSEQVIRTRSVDEDSPASKIQPSTTVDGNVQINPNIEGATVQSVEDGIIIDRTTTDENGDYTINSTESADAIQVIVDGFEDQDLSNTLYASAERTEVSGDSVNFTFDESSLVTATVNNTDVSIGNQIEEEENPVKTVGTVEQLQAMKKSPTDDYTLVRNISANKTEQWNTGSGFDPIGVSGDEFSGDLDGAGYTVEGLFIDRPSESYVGLIGYALGGASVKSVGVTDANITGEDYVGGLIGYGSNINTSDSHATGRVRGDNDIGGLVGYQGQSTLNNSYATAEVTGNLDGSGYDAGGLIGEQYQGTVNNSYATGNTTGYYVGGLIGYNGDSEILNTYATGDVKGVGYDAGGLIGSTYDAQISQSYATGNVDGENDVGGLIGYAYNDQISESYATGNAEGVDYVGGSIGYNSDTTFEKSYATGNVDGENDVGGLVGYSYNGSISETYAVGDVTGNSDMGGLIGYNDLRSSYSYWDTESTGQTLSDSGSGLTTAEMQGARALINMNGFDFTNTWDPVGSPDDYPVLQSLDEQNIGGDVDTSIDAEVNLESSGSNEVEATVLQNENVDTFQIKKVDGRSKGLDRAVGSSVSAAFGDGEYEVIATDPLGNEVLVAGDTFQDINTSDASIGGVELGTVTIEQR